MEDPLVSIIVVTRNRSFLLKHCIEHVIGQPYPRKEIIVVDSSSNDESERVVAQYPEVISVRLPGRPNQTPQARNEGIAASSGDIIAFIDDDSMVQPGWLESLIDTYCDETVGAAGGRIIDKPVPYCDQQGGSPQLVVKPSGRVTAKGIGLVSTTQVEVDLLIGCNMSFRRKALEQVGGFDSNYILTNWRDDTDMCIRVKKAGWHIVFRPAITVVHFSARSLQPYYLERPAVQFSSGCNCTYFAIKNFGLNPRTLAGQLIDAGRSCGRAVYFALLFMIGIVAHIAGRIFGLVACIYWLTSSQGRAAAAPKIGGGNRSISEQVPISGSLGDSEGIPVQ